ncbi:MAG: hypothetical protein AAGA30_00225, partial [Planctomycetota bacterium]
GTEDKANSSTRAEIVIFDGNDFQRESVNHSQWMNVQGQQQLKFELDSKPVRIGIDPYLLLPDPNPHDNLRRVNFQ